MNPLVRDVVRNRISTTVMDVLAALFRVRVLEPLSQMLAMVLPGQLRGLIDLYISARISENF